MTTDRSTKWTKHCDEVAAHRAVGNAEENPIAAVDPVFNKARAKVCSRCTRYLHKVRSINDQSSIRRK